MESPVVEIKFEKRESDQEGNMSIQMYVDGEYFMSVWSVDKEICTPDLKNAILSAIERGYTLAARKAARALQKPELMYE